jgi:hypothetical protein
MTTRKDNSLDIQDFYVPNAFLLLRLLSSVSCDMRYEAG